MKPKLPGLENGGDGLGPSAGLSPPGRLRLGFLWQYLFSLRPCPYICELCKFKLSTKSFVSISPPCFLKARYLPSRSRVGEIPTRHSHECRIHSIMLGLHPLTTKSVRLSATSNLTSHHKIIHAAAPKWSSLQYAFDKFTYQGSSARSISLSEIS